MSAAASPSLLDRRFVFVIGKGGVGKTTVATCLAVAAAARGRRTLLALCNAKERISHLLEVPPVGERIVGVRPHLDAVNMQPAAALEEYGMLVLKVRTLYKAIFENKIVASFLRGVPGLEAWSMLGKAYFHATVPRDDGSPQYDLVIVDAPATGHGLDMLRVPRVILDVAPPGLLRREAEKAWQLFEDTQRSALVLVTLPEEMPTNETLELYDALRRELRLPASHLVINGVYPTLFPASQRPVFASLPARLPPGSPLASLAAAGRARALREAMQAECITRLSAELPLPHTQLPYLFTPDFRRAAIEELAASFT
jgi:anion-transporting  ArsA/GET3 family ATPase